MFKRIATEIDSYFSRDPSARTRLEVAFCYPGFHALIMYRLTHALWNRKFKFIARFLCQFTRFLTGIEIHPAATIGERLFIDHGMGVVIGETATIGNDVTIYHGVTLGGTSWHKGKRHPQIGNNVIIGSGAQLLGAIEVGDGARIGSNAVVVQDVPAGSTMVGVPAHRVENKPIAAAFDPHMKPGQKSDPAQLIEALNARLAILEARAAEEKETAARWQPNTREDNNS